MRRPCPLLAGSFPNNARCKQRLDETMTTNQYDVFEVSARTEFNSVEDVVNVYQFQYQDVGSQADALTIVDILTIIESVYSIINAAMSILQVYRDVRIANKTQGTILGTFGFLTLTAGSNASPPVAPGVCFLVSWNTPVPRVGMRKYYGVMTEANTDADGTWSSGLVAVGTTIGALLASPLGGPTGNYLFGYLSPKTGIFELPTGVLVTDIPAYQRRRRQGRGS